MRRGRLLVALALVGCSGNRIETSAGGDFPASFPAPPQVDAFGGPVLANPHPIAVFFGQDASNAAFVAAVTDFTATLTASAYFTVATGEYGVGAGTGGPAVQLTETAPTSIDDTAIQAWLAQAVASGALPAPDVNTIYVLYYPAGTTVTLDGTTGCSTFAGYHNGAMLDDGSEVAYAVIPRCDERVASATAAASHEIAEASTDPYPHTDPAYAQVDLPDYVWELTLGGGEIGDLCAQFPQAFATFPPFPYTVQRLWSNKAALAGRDPCQPEPSGEVYVGAGLALPDMISIDVSGQTVAVKGVNIPVGQHRSIPIDLFSEAATAAFTVTPVDIGAASGAGSFLNLTVTPATGVNGDVATLDIEVLKAGTGNVEAFVVLARQDPADTKGPTGVWFGLVGN